MSNQSIDLQENLQIASENVEISSQAWDNDMFNKTKTEIYVQDMEEYLAHFEQLIDFVEAQLGLKGE